MTNNIKEPTPIHEVVPAPDEYATGAFVVPVKADTDAYRAEAEKMDRKIA